MRGPTACMLSAVLVMAGSSEVVGQTEVKIGPMVGANFADFRTKDAAEDVSIETRTGLVFGGFASIGLSRNFALQPELLYAQKGAKLPIETGVTGSIKLSYVQVPVLAQIRFPGGGAVPYLMLGPSLGFESGCKLRAESGSVSLEIDCDDPDAELTPFPSTDFSGILGVGIEVSDLTFSARYDHGLTNLNSDSSDSEKVYNRAFTFTAGYGFRIGPR